MPAPSQTPPPNATQGRSETPRRPRVLFLIPTLDRSGAEKQLTLLATAGHEAAFDAHVACLDRGGPLVRDLKAAGVPVTLIGKRGKFDWNARGRLRALIDEWRPDVVHSWLFAALGYSWLAARSLPRVHSLRCVDSWMGRWQRLQVRLFARGTRRFLANSEAVATWYREFELPAPIVVIPNGLPAEQSVPGDAVEQVRRELALPPAAKLVVIVGRLAKQKRLRDLLWAFQLLRQTDERAWLAVIGDGPLRDDVRLYAKEVECAERVRFVGHRDDVPAFLAAADVFWQGSDFEGQSNSVMEAMAAEVPVVVSSIPPNRELVEHGRSGYLVDVGDAAGFAQFTAKLLADDRLAASLATEAKRTIVSEHQLDAIVKRHAEVYRDVCDIAATSAGVAAGTRAGVAVEPVREAG